MSNARCLANLAKWLDSMMRSPAFLGWLRLSLAVQQAQITLLRALGLYRSTSSGTFNGFESRRRTI